MKKEKQKVPVWVMVVSRVFDPVVEIPLALAGAVWFSLANGLRWRFLVVLLYIDAVLPFIFFLHLLHKGEISDWDIRRKEQRLPLYLFTVMVHLAGVWLAWVAGKRELMVILLAFYLVAVVFMVITYFWKISLHAGVNALLVTFINLVIGWKYWWLYGVVVLVSWARVRGGFHRVSQVIWGAVLAMGLFLVGFYGFGRWLLGS